VDEGLQTGQVGGAGILVIDLDAHAQLLRDRCRVESELGGIGGERLVPSARIGDPSNGEHDADVMTLEIVHNIGGHAYGNAIERLSIGRLVEELEWLDKAEDHQVDRR